MKKFLLLILTVTFLQDTQGFSQDKIQQKSEQQIKDLLCRKWKLIKMKSAGKEATLPPQMQASLHFQSDGTLIETDEGKEYKGKWTYNYKTRTLVTDDRDGIENHYVIQLDNSELVYTDNKDGMKITWTFVNVK